MYVKYWQEHGMEQFIKFLVTCRNNHIIWHRADKHKVKGNQKHFSSVFIRFCVCGMVFALCLFTAEHVIFPALSWVGTWPIWPSFQQMFTTWPSHVVCVCCTFLVCCHLLHATLLRMCANYPEQPHVCHRSNLKYSIPSKEVSINAKLTHAALVLGSSKESLCHAHGCFAWLSLKVVHL